jgi:hypothetical protein
VLRFLGIYFVISVFAAIALLVDSWPHRPASPLEWVLLFVIALPVTALADWLSEGLLTNALTATIEWRTRLLKYSWLRIFYLLAMYVLFAICTVAIFYWAHV